MTLTESLQHLKTARMAVSFGLSLEWAIENILKPQKPLEDN